MGETVSKKLLEGEHNMKSLMPSSLAPLTLAPHSSSLHFWGLNAHNFQLFLSHLWRASLLPSFLSLRIVLCRLKGVNPPPRVPHQSQAGRVSSEVSRGPVNLCPFNWSFHFQVLSSAYPETIRVKRQMKKIKIMCLGTAIEGKFNAIVLMCSCFLLRKCGTN